MIETEIKRYIPEGNTHPRYRTMKSALRALGLKSQRTPTKPYSSFTFIRDMSVEEIGQLAQQLYHDIAKKYHPDVIGIETYFFTDKTYAYNRVKTMLPRWHPKGEGGGDAFYMTEQGGYNGQS